MTRFRTLASVMVLLGLALGEVQAAEPGASPEPSAAPAEAASSLGLSERRAIKKYQDEKLPGLLKDLVAAAGVDVKVDVKWETIALPGAADSYNEDFYWTQIYFQPLTAALKRIGKDDIGKAALKKSFKSIVIRHDPTTAPATNYPNGLQFDGGVLTVNWTPGVNAGDENSSDFKARVESIVGAMEPKL